MSEADSRELEIGEELAPHTPAQILAIYEGKLAIRRRLADIDPTNPQWRCDEAGILDTHRAAWHDGSGWRGKVCR